VTEPLLLEETHGRVLLLTLNRPSQRNAFTVALYNALTRRLSAAAEDDGVVAVVLTGSGPAFSAGTDLGELQAIAAGQAPAGASSAFPELLSMLIDFPLPLIAAVNGAAVGLGLTILPHCDIVLASELAKFKLPFVEMGVPPEAGSSVLLAQRMGWQTAARAMLTGDWLSASDALECGLAARLYAPDALLGASLDTATRIAEHARAAVVTLKRLMRQGERDLVLAAREREDAAYQALFGR
jgi:enoyl-CoA hydratase/carnithine racemase